MEMSMKEARIKRIRDGLHVSTSALRTFLACPYRFFLRYVAGEEPDFRPSSMVLGRAVHEALARYHLALMTGVDFGRDELVEAFDESLDREMAHHVPVKFKEGEAVNELVTTGHKLLEVYHQDACPKDIVDVERPFSVRLTDPRTGELMEPALVGVFDLLVKGSEDDQSTTVVEIKTSAKRWTSGQLELDLQTALYAEGVVQEGMAREDGSVEVVLAVLVKNKKPLLQRERVRRGPRDRRLALMVAVDVLRAIEHGSWYRNPGWQCSTCAHRRRCMAE
jgi:CRISPR/Cas system-associated exonuclease Cas4 (RecB family)